MENHPIPQDITGFQFKLIGSMTVKQFAYLAGAVIIGWFIYILPLPFLIRIPLALLLIISGVALAFIPVSGRPMDVMLGNLIKALLSPTQYVYKKDGGNIEKIQKASFVPQPKVSKNVQVLPTPSQGPDEKPQSTGTPFHGFNLHLHNPKHADKKVPEEKKGANINEDVLKKQYEDAKQIALQKELEIAKKEEEKAQGQPTFEEAHAKVLSLSEQLQTTLEEKQELERQLLTLQKKLMGDASPAQNLPPKDPPKTAASSTGGMPLMPEAANVIMGIAKDPRGNPLPNILVEVKDPEENPVRAFKTNGLGQFASATPLSNGAYTIHLEDPKGLQRFDPVTFQAVGELIPPIEVVSVDEREELRRSLFN